MSSKFFLVIVACSVCVGAVSWVFAGEEVPQVETAQQAISLAEDAVDAARVSIERGKGFVGQIPEDSDLMCDVKEMLVTTSEKWKLAINALEWAEISAEKMQAAPSDAMSVNYEVLAMSSSFISFSGANMVQVGLLFVEAVATDKAESVGIIGLALQDSMVAFEQLSFHYDGVKVALVGDNHDKAEGDGIMTELYSLFILSKLNLSKAALQGDLEVLADAQKRSDALDAVLAEARQEYNAGF